jgi:acyl-CoA hydrolase
MSPEHYEGAEALDLTRWVRPGDVIAWTQGAGEPTSIAERLLEQRHDIGKFGVLLGTTYTDLVRPEHADCIRFLGFGVVGAGKRLAAEGTFDVVPANLSQVPGLLAAGTPKVDVLMLQVSEPDEDGWYTLGAVNGYLHAAVAQARVVIAEVNAQAPRAVSRTRFSAEDFTALVHADRPLVEVADRDPTDLDAAIAAHVVDLVPERAVLQLGIGGVPSAVAAALKDRRHLGLHSGVIGDRVLDLIEAGAVDNAYKDIDRGVSVTGVLAGSRRLYRYADCRPDLRIEPVDYTHSPATLGRLRRFVAVNSALEVDLTGQVGAEVVGKRYVSTIGGQADFARAAAASEGGRSIIALPARTSKRATRIVPTLRSHVVSTPRCDVDAVVTEYGVAHLRGCSIRERVHALAAVAHPEDRDDLLRQAAEVVAGYA